MSLKYFICQIYPGVIGRCHIYVFADAAGK